MIRPKNGIVMEYTLFLEGKLYRVAQKKWTNVQSAISREPLKLE